MSRLAKEVYAQGTSKYVPLNDWAVTSDIKEDKMTWGRKYCLGLRLQYEVVIPEHAPELLDLLTKQAKRAVVDYAFGEFREPMSKLRFALYNRDFDKALLAVDKLESQMFSPDT